MIDISIIIVNYQNYSILNDCLVSLYKYANGFSFEVIVVDNASKNFPETEIKSRFPGLKYILNKDNTGFSAANNQGMLLATGEYYLILNNDMIFIENCLLPLIKFLKSLPPMTLVACELLNKDFTHQISIANFDNFVNSLGEAFFLYKLFPKNKKLNKYHQNFHKYEFPVETDIIKGAFILGSEKVFQCLNGFDERFFFYAEEADMCFNLKRLGGKVFYYPASQIIHLGGATTENIPWFGFKNLHIATIQFYQKNYMEPVRSLLILIKYTGILLRVLLYLFVAVLGFKRNYLLKAKYFSRLLFIYPKNLF